MLHAGLTTNVDELHALAASMADEICRPKEQLALATHHRFGRKSEGFSPDQLALFIAPDIDIVVEENTLPDTPSTAPKSKRTLRQAVIVRKDMEAETVEHDLDDTEKVCDCCQQALHKIGEDRGLQVEYIPHKTKVMATVRPKYACRHCETGVKQLPLPPSPIPKSMATPSLPVFLIVSKFCDHLPMHRIQQMLLRVGIHLHQAPQIFTMTPYYRCKIAINRGVAWCSQYVLNHWSTLTRYCDAGYLAIDNNFSEREIRPVALGRKNYLFTGSERGGGAAVLYSLVASAKINRLNIYDYINDLITRLPIAVSENDFEALLPYHWRPPLP